MSIQHSLIEESRMGDGCSIGLYSHLRPGNSLGRQVKIGNFSEIKKSVVGDNSKVSHLSYVGDAFLGKNVNIGVEPLRAIMMGITNGPPGLMMVY
ncbi:MAG: hypothetical protein RQM92_17805 [Candidatus Syntrophopropionicum ammoniitolerans]